MSTAAPPCTDLLEVGDASIYHEIRGKGALVLLVGSPMDAVSFESFAELLATDRMVVTIDPRGINRSPVKDPDRDSTPEQRADDLAALITHLDAGPALAFGSSGGAVSVLALAEHHPEAVSTVIAHEPPLVNLLEDPVAERAATEEIVATFLTEGRAAAWTKFMANANIQIPPPVIDEIFGGELQDQEAADEHFFFVHEMRASTFWQPDLDALRPLASRLNIGIGEDSGDKICDRTSRALAADLGVEPTMFPGGHIGFVEDPERFVERLRAILK